MIHLTSYEDITFLLFFPCMTHMSSILHLFFLLAWPPEVLSNMLRVLVLWHYGGIYSDTDILSIRPFTVPLNATGVDAHALVGSALYAFSAHHPLLWTLMEDINREFLVS